MAESERSSEDIRRDIAREEQTLSHTVEQIGERIKDTLDWRTQVKKKPYWALGAAAGLGYFASKIFARRATPMEQILGSLGGSSSAAPRSGLIKMTLLGIASKAAADWIRHECQHDSGARGGDAPRPWTGRDSEIDQETTR